MEIREAWPEARQAQRGRRAPRQDATRRLKGRPEPASRPRRNAPRGSERKGRRPAQREKGAAMRRAAGRTRWIVLAEPTLLRSLAKAKALICFMPRVLNAAQSRTAERILRRAGRGAPAASCGPSPQSEAAVSVVGIGESRAVGRGFRFSSGGLILFRNTAWLPRGGPPVPAGPERAETAAFAGPRSARLTTKRGCTGRGPSESEKECFRGGGRGAADAQE